MKNRIITILKSVVDFFTRDLTPPKAPAKTVRKPKAKK
jgi:hypothetical protein